MFLVPRLRLIGADFGSGSLSSRRDVKIIARRFIAGKASKRIPVVPEGRLIRKVFLL